MRTRGRRDNNHREIVTALRHAGMTVLDLASVGGGCPDLLVGWRGQQWLVEVKSDGGRLTAAQQEFLDTWAGDVIVAHDIEEAITQITKRV